MASPEDATAWCAAIRAALLLERAGNGVVYGPEVETTAIPIVERLRARGAHFYWVALPIQSISFWELHVGIVVDRAAGTARSGLHRSNSSAFGARLFAVLEGGRAARGLERFDSEAAEEMQFLYPLHALNDTSAIAKLCSEAHDLLTWASAGLEDLT